MTSASKQIKVLIVDDSAFMRKALSMMLEEDPDIKVVGSARDGEEGVEKVKRLQPDLVTMDIEMPRAPADHERMPGAGDDGIIPDH